MPLILKCHNRFVHPSWKNNANWKRVKLGQTTLLILTVEWCLRSRSKQGQTQNAAHILNTSRLQNTDVHENKLKWVNICLAWFCGCFKASSNEELWGRFLRTWVLSEGLVLTLILSKTNQDQLNQWLTIENQSKMIQLIIRDPSVFTSVSSFWIRNGVDTHTTEQIVWCC